MSDSIPTAGEAVPPPTGQMALADLARALLDTWRELAEAHVQVVILEVRHASLNVVAMLGMGVAAGVLAVTSWLLIVGMSILWAMKSGVQWELAILLAAGFNLAFAALLCGLIRRYSRRLFSDRGHLRTTPGLGLSP